MMGPRDRAPSFKLEIPGDRDYQNVFMSNLKAVRLQLKERLGPSVTYATVMDALLRCWGKNTDRETLEKPAVDTYTPVDRKGTEQELYIVARTSLQILVDVVQTHAHSCSANLTLSAVLRRGHVAMCTASCNSQKGHSYRWSSSPYLPNTSFLANERVQHAVIFSGMLPSNYRRFCDGAGIGQVSSAAEDEFFAMYKENIADEYQDSIDRALQMEVASYDFSASKDGDGTATDENTEEWHGINIITDARHGWRKNAKDTSVVTIGEKSSMVLLHTHVTKADDHVTQRHELLGTKQVYEYFESRDTPVAVHCHDRNMAVNKYVRDRAKAYTTNQNDCWHGVKALKKSVTGISAGPKYKLGITWHPQLEDKVEPIATHAYWLLKNCDGNVAKLEVGLLNIVEHYKNDHRNCPPQSRCRRDPNYEPSRIMITNAKAEELLTAVIRHSVLYKSARDFVLGKESYLVESFNNLMNVFQDKRISYGNPQYLARSQIAVCHWNENQGRPCTSRWHPKSNPRAPRCKNGKKNYVACTYKYRDSVWDRHIVKLFKSQ